MVQQRPNNNIIKANNDKAQNIIIIINFFQWRFIKLFSFLISNSNCISFFQDIKNLYTKTT